MSTGTTGVFAARSAYLDRWVQVGIASGSVISVAFPDAEPPDHGGDHAVLDRLLGYLDEGRDESFVDVDIALTVGTNPRRAFQTVRSIPFGHELSLDEVVARTAILEPGEESLETVRSALAANPIPVVIPDHRVSDAAGGVDEGIRTKLRELEGLA